MNYIKFQRTFSIYPVFSLEDVRKIDPEFNRIQLSRWEKKGYIKRIKKTFYFFDGQALDTNFLLYAANKIYAPSYVSLETALKYYQLIAGEISEITSISPNKTAGFKNFDYKHLSQYLYFGHTLLSVGKFKIRIAEVEKALLDYLYFHPELKTPADFESIGINVQEFERAVDLKKLHEYLDFFGRKELKRRAKIFLATMFDV